MSRTTFLNVHHKRKHHFQTRRQNERANIFSTLSLSKQTSEITLSLEDSHCRNIFDLQTWQFLDVYNLLKTNFVKVDKNNSLTNFCTTYSNYVRMNNLNLWSLNQFSTGIHKFQFHTYYIALSMLRLFWGELAIITASYSRVLGFDPTFFSTLGFRTTLKKKKAESLEIC